MADIIADYTIGLKDLQKFKDIGQFQNNIDQFGNFKLIYDKNKTDDGKYFYTNLELKNLSYNEEKIKDTNIVEFIELQTLQTEQKQDLNLVLEKYNEAIAENKILNETVNSLVEKYENSDDKQIISAMKTEIVNLRIKLGQGNVPGDFSDIFPFLPLT